MRYSVALWRALKRALFPAIVLLLLVLPATAFAGSLVGTVTDESTGAGLEGIVVNLHEVPPAIDPFAPPYLSTLTDAYGAYRFDDLPSSLFYVSFTDPNSVYATEYYPEQSTPEFAEWVFVPEIGDTPPVNATLTRLNGLAGRVTSQETGQPMSGVAVEIWLLAGEPPSFELAMDVAVLPTDANGEWEAQLPDGYYAVHFIPGGGALEEWYNDRTDGGWDAIQLAGGSTERADASLAMGGAISGQVVDPGAPHIVGDIFPYVVQAFRETSPGEWTFAASTAAGVDGAFRIARLTPGAYRLRFWDAANDANRQYYTYYPQTLDPADAWSVAVQPGLETGGLLCTIRMPAPSGGIQGTVRSAASQSPLSGTAVQITRTGDFPGEAYAAGALSMAEGGFEFSNVPAGSYKVSFTGPAGYLPQWYSGAALEAAATPVVVSDGQITGGIDAGMRPDITTVTGISGHVFDATEQPISGMVVQLLQASSPLPDGASEQWTTTDESGFYQFAEIPPGEYKVNFAGCADRAAQFYGGTTDFATATPISLAEGENRQNVDALLSGPASEGGVITGVVLDAQTGDPVADAQVTAACTWPFPNVFTAVTDASGAYSMTVNPGEYRIAFICDGRYVSEYYNDVKGDAIASAVPVGSGATFWANAALTPLPALGTITGTVSTSDAQPLPETTVYFVSAGGEQFSTQVAPDGTYASDPLRAGDYYVYFEPSALYQAAYYPGVLLPEDATPVFVPSGGTANLADVVLNRMFTISGLVTDDESLAPLEGVWVYAGTVDLGSFSGIACTQTGPDGRYVITGLDPSVGSVCLRFTEIDGTHRQEYSGDTLDPTQATFYPVQLGSAVENADAGLLQMLRAEPDAYVVPAGQSLDVPAQGVLANDLYRGSGPLTVLGATQPTMGVVDVRTDGSFTYTPSFGFLGTDQFTYTATDGLFYSRTTVVVEVSDQPVYGSLGGTVLGADDLSGLSGALVTLEQAEVPPGVEGYSASTNCDASGAYSFGSVPVGTYQIHASRPGYVPGSTSAVVVWDRTTSGVDITLAVGYLVSGRVVDADTQNPLAGIAVDAGTLQGTEFQKWVGVVTDADGRYKLGLESALTDMRLRFTDTGSRYATEYYSEVTDVAQSATVPLEFGVALTGYDEALRLVFVGGYDGYDVPAGSTLTVAEPGVMGNDLYPGESTWVVLDRAPVWGTLDLTADGAFTYTPDPDYEGTDSFYYRLTDGTFTSDPLLVDLVVRANHAPEILQIAGPDAPLALGTSAGVTTTFDDPDADDTHTVRIDWGDGFAEAAIVDQDAHTASGSRTYAAPGVYVVTVTVSDQHGSTLTSEYRYIVAYDPTAGFVSGKGTIYSPPGAYAADPTAEGPASFGFVSRYKKGATVPVGNTEFLFNTAAFEFQSTAYDWLVVSRNGTAKYKGVGTVNGAGSYGFMISCVDASPDRLRVKIWDAATGAVVYDNQMESDETAVPTTALASGHIMVHAK